MTEKRFELLLYDNTMRVKEIRDNGKVIYPNEVVHLLNELDERYVDEFSLRETLQQELQRVEKENEQLRKQNEELIKGMQETARLSAKAITKPMVEARWGKGVDYD